MTRTEFAALTAAGPLLLDGATGSNLLQRGMPRGVCAEQWILEHPTVLQTLQQQYVQAGSRIVYAPTFGGNRMALALHGQAAQLDTLNRRLVALSKQAVGDAALVAGDMTTCGKPAEPLGPMTYEQLLALYSEQAAALLDAGVDLFVVETMMGLTETQAALEAIRMICDLPVLCTLSLSADGRAYYDGTGEEAAELLEALGADAVGVNCSVGPDQLDTVIRRICQATSLPVIAKPNAGMPTINARGQAVYSLSAPQFASAMVRLRDAGAGIFGGCCGTDPSYISALRDALTA